jgi:hypothetical protein
MAAASFDAFQPGFLLVFLGELAERLAEVVVRGGLGYAKDGIGIAHNRQM